MRHEIITIAVTRYEPGAVLDNRKAFYSAGRRLLDFAHIEQLGSAIKAEWRAEESATHLVVDWKNATQVYSRPTVVFTAMQEVWAIQLLAFGFDSLSRDKKPREVAVLERLYGGMDLSQSYGFDHILDNTKRYFEKLPSGVPLCQIWLWEVETKSMHCLNENAHHCLGVIDTALLDGIVGDVRTDCPHSFREICGLRVRHFTEGDELPMCDVYGVDDGRESDMVGLGDIYRLGNAVIQERELKSINRFCAGHLVSTDEMLSERWIANAPMWAITLQSNHFTGSHQQLSAWDNEFLLDNGWAIIADARPAAERLMCKLDDAHILTLWTQERGPEKDDITPIYLGRIMPKRLPAALRKSRKAEYLYG